MPFNIIQDVGFQCYLKSSVHGICITFVCVICINYTHVICVYVNAGETLPT